MDLHIPDLSKWQASVDFTKLGPAVILRAHSGYGVDPTFAERQTLARKHQQVRGFYLFLVKDRDAATQAAEAAKAIGRLLPGEFCVVDVEQGDGNETARAETACATLDRDCGGQSWVYSGLSFYMTHLTGLHRRLWLAAYRPVEPTGPAHLLWQHTDAEPHPGVGPCDCSIFHGTVQQLVDLVSPPAKPAGHTPAGTPPWFFRDLREMSPEQRGVDVSHLQMALGMPRERITGVYDHETQTALDQWRRSQGLPHGFVLDTDTARRLWTWLVNK